MVLDIINRIHNHTFCKSYDCTLFNYYIYLILISTPSAFSTKALHLGHLCTSFEFPQHFNSSSIFFSQLILGCALWLHKQQTSVPHSSHLAILSCLFTSFTILLHFGLAHQRDIGSWETWLLLRNSLYFEKISIGTVSWISFYVII